MSDAELKALQKALAALEAAGASTRDLQKQITTYTTQQIDALNEKAKVQSKVADAIKAEKASRDIIAIQQQNQAKLLEEMVATAANENERVQRTVDLRRAEIDRLNEKLRVHGKLEKADQEALKTAQAQLKIDEDRLNTMRDTRTAAKDIANSFASLATFKDGTGGFSLKTLTAKARSMNTLIKGAGSLTGALKALGPALAVAVATKFIDNMVNLALTLYDAEQAFRATTGASREFAAGLTATYEATRLYGITADEAAKLTKDLMTTFTDFTMLTATQRAELTNTVGVLGEMGFAFSDQAKIVQAATKGMGVSVGQMDDTLRELTAHAMDIGMPIDQMTTGLAGAAGEFAKFGSEGVQAMKDVATASKITGIEMGRILQIAAKFDTFEGAAKQAGMLNAALGGNFVNAMDLMMTTDPVDRFQMIQDSINQMGVSFDDMGYYQRQFIAESAGLKDVGELALLMSGDFKSLDENIGKTSKDYEDMAKAAADVQTLQASFQALLAEMTPILTPIIEGLRDMIGWLKENPKVLKGFAAAVVALGTGLTVLAALTMKTIIPVLGSLGLAFLSATAPVWAIPVAIAAAIAAFAALASLLFEEPFASTYLQGLVKFAAAFTGIGLAVQLLGPIVTKAKEWFDDFWGDETEGLSATRTGLIEIEHSVAKTGKVPTLSGKEAALRARTPSPADQSPTVAATQLTAAMQVASTSTAEATTKALSAPVIEMKNMQENKKPDHYTMPLVVNVGDKPIVDMVVDVVGGQTRNSVLGT